MPVVAVGLLLGAIPVFVAKADDDDKNDKGVKKPKIKTIQVVESKAVQIPFTWKQYTKSTDVKVKVRVEDVKTGNVSFQSIDSRVNGNGNGKVWVKNLKPSTEYRFKIKVRKITLNRTSDYSSRKTATTLAETRRSTSSTEQESSTTSSTSNNQNTGSTGSSSSSDSNSSSSSE